MTWYSVMVALEGSPPENEALDRYLDALMDRRDLSGQVGSWGGTAGGPGATVSVDAGNAMEALGLAVTAIRGAAWDAGIDAGDVAHAELMTEDFQETWLAQPAPEYVGVSEIAAILGVSRQRVSQLRERDDFPKPIAKLAMGPIWTRTSLNHFVDEWPRQPGRPRLTLYRDGNVLRNSKGQAVAVIRDASTGRATKKAAARRGVAADHTGRRSR